jgi:hypothetical protein
MIGQELVSRGRISVLYLNPPEQALVLCVDEESQVQALERSQPVLPIGLGCNDPEELDTHLVLDNYATHEHPEVRAWFARRPRFHVHFAPTHSSWLNQVERWFGLISAQVCGFAGCRVHQGAKRDPYCPAERGRRHGDCFN